jgi:hypothetical protein
MLKPDLKLTVTIDESNRTIVVTRKYFDGREARPITYTLSNAHEYLSDWESDPVAYAVDIAFISDFRSAIKLLTENPCKCVDCGGDQPTHSSDCTEMALLHGDQ